MLDTLGRKFDQILKTLRGHGVLTEQNIADALKEVRLALLEADVNFRIVKEFVERVCGASKDSQEKTLKILRLDATYQFAEFLFLLQSFHIETENDLRRLAEGHNKYIVELTKDADKMMIIPNHMGTWKYKLRMDSCSIGRAGTGIRKPAITV